MFLNGFTRYQHCYCSWVSENRVIIGPRLTSSPTAVLIDRGKKHNKNRKEAGKWGKCSYIFLCISWLWKENDERPGILAWGKSMVFLQTVREIAAAIDKFDSRSHLPFLELLGHRAADLLIRDLPSFRPMYSPWPAPSAKRPASKNRSILTRSAPSHGTRRRIFFFSKLTGIKAWASEATTGSCLARYEVVNISDSGSACRRCEGDFTSCLLTAAKRAHQKLELLAVHSGKAVFFQFPLSEE